MSFGWDKVTLGRTGLTVSKLGLASSFGLEPKDIEAAAERGINYFYWGSIRRAGFGQGVRELAKKQRDEMVIVVQSYTRMACLMRTSLERALKKLGIDHTDLLLLGWWNDLPPQKIIDAARALVDAGKARHVMVSCHHRPSFKRFIDDPTYGAIMVRYNAAHPGAEREVFPHLQSDHAARPGVVSYTATRWGGLLNPNLLPEGEAPPRGSDCYRFALTQPDVDVTLSGPKNAEELTEAMAALDRGPMSEDELAWMKRVGRAVREASIKKGSGNAPVQLLDKWFGGPSPS